MLRTTLRLTLSCSNQCVFCAQEGLPPDAGDPPSVDELRDRLQELSEGAEEITLIGGEPTLHPALAAVVETARECGFERVGLQTNARAFAGGGLVASLAMAGLTDVQVSLHGAEAAAHDYHTGVAGSFDAVLAGVAASRAHGLTVVAATVLTRSSFRSLANLPWLLKSRGASGWLVAVARARGRAARAPALHRVIPRLGVALPYALHALDAAGRIGLPAWIQGAPLCLLGPFAARALAGDSDAGGSYGEGCAGCAARSACSGLDPAYAARFAAGELSAMSSGPPLDTDHEELARMFVGPGDLGASPALDEIPAPPSAAADRLAELGRARPSADE